LLIGGVNTLALLVAGALLLALSLTPLAAARLPHRGRTLALHSSASPTLPASAAALGIQHGADSQ
jgi:hypothetical protein